MIRTLLRAAALCALLAACGTDRPAQTASREPLGFGTDQKDFRLLPNGRFETEGDRIRACYNTGS